jgi:hypothetical protein
MPQRQVFRLLCLFRFAKLGSTRFDWACTIYLVFETSARVHHMRRWMCQMFILGMKKDAGFLTSDEPIFLRY